MSRTKLVLLGTGTPNAEAQGSGPSSAVIVDDKAYIIVPMQIHKKHLIDNYSEMIINKLFI